MSWILVIMNHFWIALAISFNEHFKNDQTFLYLSGIVVSAVVGYFCLSKLKSLEGNTDLDRFHGHSSKHPKLAFIFLMACLLIGSVQAQNGKFLKERIFKKKQE